MSKFSAAQFVREVRKEISKVTWPDRKETITTSFMVLMMTILSSLFFLISDTIISSVINLIFKLGLKI